MNRLTEKDIQGNWGLKGIRWEQLHEGQVITGELWEKLYGALWKLMEYEDTGLMPEEVEKMRDERCWVPLMERPPKDGQEVWVSTKMGGVYLATYHESYGVCERSVFLLNFGIIQVDDVTAWQPSNPPNAYTSAIKQNKPSGWQEQMMGAFLGDSRL